MSRLSQVLVRVDGGADIGAGHVMRCLALAQEFLARGAIVTFASAHSFPGFKSRLTAEGFDFAPVSALRGSDGDARATVDLARRLGAELVVIDGYGFTSQYQKVIRDAAPEVLIIDDDATLGPYHVDYILNQNQGAGAAMYDGLAGGARLLLGADYVLLRNEFLEARRESRPVAKRARRILVTMGGSDPLNVTEAVVEGLVSILGGDQEIAVVPGGDGDRTGRMRALGGAGRPAIEIHDKTDDMAALMAAADIAIVSAGVTLWEAAFMGLPAVAVVVADNQQNSAAAFADAGCGRSYDARAGLPLGAITDRVGALIDDAGTRASWSARGRALIDGRGRGRVCDAVGVTGKDNPDALILRPATRDDQGMLLDWRNDPVTRANSKDQGRVTLEDHRAWLAKILSDPDRRLFVAEESGQSVGTVRAEKTSAGWDLSWTVAPDARGQGVGTRMVGLMVERLEGVISADVKTANRASQKIARAAGMQPRGRSGDIIHLSVER